MHIDMYSPLKCRTESCHCPKIRCPGEARFARVMWEEKRNKRAAQGPGRTAGVLRSAGLPPTRGSRCSRGKAAPPPPLSPCRANGFPVDAGIPGRGRKGPGRLLSPRFLSRLFTPSARVGVGVGRAAAAAAAAAAATAEAQTSPSRARSLSGTGATSALPAQKLPGTGPPKPAPPTRPRLPDSPCDRSSRRVGATPASSAFASAGSLRRTGSFRRAGAAPRAPE